MRLLDRPQQESGEDEPMMVWLAIAMLSVGWLWGTHYFAPAQTVWYLLSLAGSVLLLALGFRSCSQKHFLQNPATDPLKTRSTAQPTHRPSSPSASEAENRPVQKTEPSNGLPPVQETEQSAALEAPRGVRLGVAAFLLLPVVCWPWPEKMGPVLMLAGWLGLWLAESSPLVGRSTRRLSRAALLAGIILVSHTLVLEFYQAQTARTHDLPAWLRPIAVALAKLLDAEAAAAGADLVFRVLGQPHRIALCWDWFLDPATVLFFTGGLVWLAWRCGESVPAGRRWTCWLAGFRRFCGLMGLWILVRWMLVLGLYLHRAGLEGIEGEHLAIAQMFSPWFHLLLLLAPALWAGWSFRDFPDTTSMLAETPAQAELSASQGETVLIGGSSGVWSGRSARSGSRMRWAAVWLAVGSALMAGASLWTPIGRPKQGRVLVVERHSQWEPTLRPYDTTWYGEPSGYNYRLIYDFCRHFFQMGRILESEPITEERLQECDVLIIKIPTAPYQPKEIEAVHRFVANGGSLLLIGDHTNVFRSSTYLNAICRPMGFTFRNDLLFCIGSPYQQKYHRPWPVHPAVAMVPEMDFAVSCSIDPGRSWGRAVIRSTGLWSLPAAYEASNYHPHAEYQPHLRAGAFVQLWATSYGRGRVLAFTDSTIFSNFCTFQPGKAELFLNMLHWLNHRSPLDPWPIQAAVTLGLGLVGLVLVGLGCWKAYPPARPTEQTVPSGEKPGSLAKGSQPKKAAEPARLSAPPAIEALHLLTDAGLVKATVLLAASMIGVTAAWAALDAYHRSAPLDLQRALQEKPFRLAVIDRTVSQVPLANGAFNQSPDGFGLLEHTIPRLGYVTARRTGLDAFGGDLLVVIAPNRSVSHEYREALASYVFQGGKLLVIDHPGNRHSTAGSLLEPFGLQIQHDPLAPAGPLGVAGRSTGVSVESACVVSGGEGLVFVGQQPVAARIQYGQGWIVAIGFGQIWTDRQMHPDEWRANWMPEPTREMLARYELFYSLFRALAEGGPIQPPKAAPQALPTPEAPEVPEPPPIPKVPQTPKTPPGPEAPLVPEKIEKETVPPTPIPPKRLTPPRHRRSGVAAPVGPDTPEAPLEPEKSPLEIPSEKARP